jgi:hypothetical protein
MTLTTGICLATAILVIVGCSDDDAKTTDSGVVGDQQVTVDTVAGGDQQTIDDSAVTKLDGPEFLDGPAKLDGPVFLDGPVKYDQSPATDLAADATQPDTFVLPTCGAFPAGCMSNDWVDARNDINLRKVEVTLGSWKPKCLWIKPLQKVIFTGLVMKPITQICGPEEVFSGGVGTSNTKTFTFTKQGSYGYEWQPGGANLFRGAVKASYF